MVFSHLVRKKILFLSVALLIVNCSLLIPTTHAISDPTVTSNNKFGIHIISATKDEASEAASLVNSSGGDWGYITVLIESKDRNDSKWQEFFNELRRKHLIPIVRLATKPSGNFWEKPYEGEEQAWVDFLDKLNWPTKNRYVTIFNEPNHSAEWGNTVSAKEYAEVLNKTIDALKTKNEDFFVLNAGLDASAPQKLPAYQDELEFLKGMDEAVPGIFNKLDGWVSHSYPNPGFTGSPNAQGRGTVRTWFWELQVLRQLGLTKNLPVFITETGWKHSDGVIFDYSLPSPEKVGAYFQSAFDGAWNSSRVVAVTPFLLNYQDPPFDHFSLKKIINNDKSATSAAQQDFHFPYYVLKNIPKSSGVPIQENKAKLINGEIYHSLVAGEKYNIELTFQNIGQSIWNDEKLVSLVPTSGGKTLGMEKMIIPKDTKVEPNGKYTFNFQIKAPTSGSYEVKLNLYSEDKPFDSEGYQFSGQVKQPVILKVHSGLQWKENFEGNYILTVAGTIGQTMTNLVLGKGGNSEEIETRYLLPDYAFDFTLEKPFYKSKTIHQKVISGVNELEFGELQPNIPSAILKPTELWKLLPFSN